MKQGSVLYLSLVVLSCGLGLTSACSDDEDPSECTGADCGGAANGGGTATAGAKATGGSKATGGATSTARGGATGIGGATATGGTTAAVVGGATATGGTTAVVVGGATATGGTTAAGGATTAAGGATTATAGSTSLGGTTGLAGNAGTANNAGTAGTAGAPPLGPNLAQGTTWWGGDAPTATGNYPRAFASSQSTTNNTPNKLFDGINSGASSIWVSKTVPTTGAPELLGVEFELPVTVSAVVLEGRINGSIAYNPSDYTVETSDTGADGTWTVRATVTRAQTRAIIASNPEPITTRLPAPVTSKWIRLRITDTWYTNGTKVPDSTQLAELRIH